MGSQSDHAVEPRCELMIRWRETVEDSSEYLFDQNSQICQGVNEIFSKLRTSYALNIEIKETTFSIDNEKISILEQGIDSYGKTRMLRIKYDKNILTLLTSPIQPMNYPEINSWVVTKVPENIASKFLQGFKYPNY